MKHLFLTIILAAGICQFVGAQDNSADDGPSLRERIARKQDAAAKVQRKGLPQLSVRAENMNQSQTQDISNAPWVREIYRSLDLNEDKNASLYYPDYPVGDRMNLFTMMFKLLESGDINAYEFSIDGQEIFTDQRKLNFKDLLNKFSIMYTEQDGVISVEDYDIPSNEVLRYYIKEAWYFDQSNSVVDVKILALCPVLMRQDDFGVESTPYPLFWMPYENIRPYAARMPIMTSNLNNASRQTIDDYFRKRSYDGEIYKTTNMRNRSLAELFPTDSLRKKEGKRIEDELKSFKNNLWVLNDTVKVEKAKDTKSVKEDTEAETEESKGKVPVRTNEKKTGKTKVEKAKSPKSSSSSARSMRSRRSR